MSLPVVRTGNVPLDRFLEQVREYIETSRGGTNATAQNRVLRVSDLSSIVQLSAAGAAKITKQYTQEEMEKFASDLANTRLFQSLTGKGSSVAEAIAGLPVTNITSVKTQKGQSAAGVTSNAVVAAEDGRSVSAMVTTVEARLDNFDGTASIEEAYLALADATTGLEAQYTVKVTAGGAVAGFGIAATDPVGGTPSSAFLISADKFAVVSPSYSGGLTLSPSSANIPFGVDSSGVYINGTVRINAGGPAIEDGLEGPPGPPGATGATGARGATRTVRTVAGLSSWSDSEANSAIAALGFSPVIRDEVTLRDSATSPSYVETKYWGPGWTSIGVTINGNLLVSGSITSDKIGTNTLTATTIDTTGAIKAKSSLSVSGGSEKASIVGYNTSSSGSEIGVYGHSAVASGVHGNCASTTGGNGVYGLGYYGGYFTTNTAGGSGLFAGNPYGNTAITIAGKMQWGTTLISQPPGGTTNFLRADGTWAAPSGGGGGVTSFNGRTGAVTLDSTDIATYASGTLSVNVTGTAGNASALGGLSPSNWVQFVGTSTASRTFAGYMQVYANGVNAWIPLYV